MDDVINYGIIIDHKIYSTDLVDSEKSECNQCSFHRNCSEKYVNLCIDGNPEWTDGISAIFKDTRRTSNINFGYILKDIQYEVKVCNLDEKCNTCALHLKCKEIEYSDICKDFELFILK